MHHRRATGERGAIAVFFALFLTALIGLTALLIDLGQSRVATRDEQRIVDLAALAAGRQLTAALPVSACRDAIRNLNINDRRLPSQIDPVQFCSSISNICTNATTPSTPTTTLGDVTVSIHYPVPASEIQSSYWSGAGHNDGPSGCQRMRVLVTRKDTSLFATVFGSSGATTTRTATVRPYPNPGAPPALWLLDPTGCVPLKVDGGSEVTVGSDTVKGVVTLNSDGTTCSGGASTISSTGTGTFIKAIAPNGKQGQINLVALPQGSTGCIIPACDPNDVIGGRISPQPTSGTVASRAVVDWIYNCKAGYPTFHGTQIYDCPYTTAFGGTRAPYIDNLKSEIGAAGSTPPIGNWTVIGPGGNQCDPSSSVTYPIGNYYVKCNRGNNGFTVNSGVTIEFKGGNVVFDDNVTVGNGGTLKFNTDTTTTNNTTRFASLPANCVPPTVTTPCINESSPDASFVFIRGDNSTTFSTSGSGAVEADHVFVYGGTGSVAFSGNPPIWTAPIEGPFSALAYWTDMPASATNAQRSSFTITGGSGADLAGVFFTPEADPFKLAGGGNWGQQHAQFISYQLTVTGGGILSLSPDPKFPAPLLPKGYLIR